ncbi:hypothetical protein H6G36_02505 [Anabaena minutissima FACHB-250]|nr:hypothetical protein [Anabaena minutissima FACHB-250]
MLSSHEGKVIFRIGNFKLPQAWILSEFFRDSWQVTGGAEGQKLFTAASA